MDEPEWTTVLRIFWEENLNFEYSPGPKKWDTFIPDHPDLDGINVPDHCRDLLKSGYLEVEDVDASHDPSAPFDSLAVVRISEKGIQTIHEWKTLKKEKEFEKKQVTRSNEVNAAIGYLTVGLLFVTLSDVFLSVSQTWMPTWVILGLMLIVVTGLVFKIRSSGLLNP